MIPTRVMRFVGPAIVVAAALVSLVLGLLFGGGAAPLLVGDAGPGRALGAADRHPRREPVGGGHDRIPRARAVRAARRERPFDTALDVASISAALFTVASGFTAFFTFVNIFNATPNAGAEFGGQLGRFLVSTDPGRAWALTTLAGAALTVLTFAVRGWISTLFRRRAGHRQPRADGDAGPFRRRRRPQHRGLRTRAAHHRGRRLGSAACCC